jgi:transposase
MPRATAPVILSEDQRKQLEVWLSALGTPQQVALRCRIVLCCAAGRTEVETAAENQINRKTVRLWRERFSTQGLEALWEIAPGRGRKPVYDAARVKEVIDATLQTKPKGSTQWSCRSMAEAQGMSKSTVNNIWRSHNIKPHRSQTFKLSRDPKFVEKLTDVVGLYLNPPDKAIVLCVDEKSQIQALNRTQPGLPLKKGRCGTMTHDYKRNGTTTLFAALDLLEGKVIGDCYSRHRHQEFLKFLRRIHREFPGDNELHLVMDNYGTHGTPEVKAWLKKHPRFVIHYVPTSSSWLNLIERWFAELTTKRIRRDSFFSVEELVHAVHEFLNAWNEKPRPFVWTATVDSILAKLARCRQTLERIQPGCTLPKTHKRKTT